MKKNFYNLVVKVLTKIFKGGIIIDNTPSVPKGNFRTSEKER